MTAKGSISKVKNGKSKARKGCMTIILSLFAAVIIFLLIGLLVLGSLVFDPEKQFHVQPLTTGEVFIQSQIINRIIPVVMNSQINTVAQLELTPAEVNAIIRFVENSGTIGDFLAGQKTVSPESTKIPYKLSYDKGEFTVQFSADTGFDNPFGSHVMINLKGTPLINDKGASLEVEEASVGLVPIPTRQAEIILQTIINNYRDHDVFKSIKHIVKKAYVAPNGNLIIFYYPYRLRQYVMKSFLWNFN
ncbi:MAG: hypothetical protein GY750_03660 [Lentisphaerae bacterium]|nr:hypothetical protein [Lentisphaerota bacterium]MCP4100513.1 hypothetical protein [Lentisphaerota bacterium]